MSFFTRVFLIFLLFAVVPPRFIAGAHGSHVVSYTGVGAQRHSTLVPVVVNSGVNLLYLCENSDTSRLGFWLSVADTVVGDTVYWSAVNAPLHGTLFAQDTTIANGDTLHPTKAFYVPDHGYWGIDTFSVMIGSSAGYDTIVFAVNVDSLPLAGSIAASRDSLCEGDTLHLMPSVSGGIWNITNGSAVIDTGLLTAVLSGDDTVLYLVSNGCGTDTARFPFRVVPLAIPGAIVGHPVCAGGTYVFTSSVPDGVWQITNNNASINDTGLVTGLKPGLDTVYYSVTNICGTRTSSYVVSVDTPTSVPAISGTFRVCAGGTDTLTNSKPGGTWAVTNGSIVISQWDTTAILSGLLPGLDTVLYVIVNGCGVYDDIRQVRVDSFPIVYPVIAPNAVCVNYSGTATDTVPAFMGTFTWTVTNSHLSINNSGLIHGVTAGLDTVVFTCTNSCGMASASRVVTVNPQPDAGTIAGTDTLCVGETVTYTDTTANGPGNWSVGTMSADSSYTVFSTQNFGPVKITFKMKNVCGPKSVSKVVQVMKVPDGLLVSGPGSVCEGQGVTLTNYVKGGYWYSRQSNVSIDSFTGYMIGVSPGSDTVIYTVSNICGSDSELVPETINANPPVLNISRMGNLLRVDSGYSFYQWTRDGLPVEGAVADTFTVATTGVYQVWVGNSAGCSTQAEFMQVSDLAACLESDLKVYPNPSAGIVYVRWCNYANVRIYTLDGKILDTRYHARDLDISGLPDGSYLFGLYRDDGSLIQTKLIGKIAR